MTTKEKKILLFLVVLTILSFLMMDFNGPFFIMKDRKYHNSTDINAILTWSKEGWQLVSFAINLPFIVFLNWVSLMLFFWLKNHCKKYPKYGFLYSLLLVVMVYLVISLVWIIIAITQSSDFLFQLGHPLEVLVGVGFFISNLIFFSLWHLIGYLKERIMSKA